MHTGPVKRAGGLSGWMETPSVDGHFDRISTRIDPVFGTEDEFRSLCEVADSHGGSVLDDIVPGHTGKGADFRLAEMAYEDYPGIYHMVEIPEEDWHLLPDVPEGRDAVNLDATVEQELADHGYIIGALQRVIFYAPGDQGDQLERNGSRHRRRRTRAPLGLPALLQDGPAVDQLARPHVRRDAPGHRRRPALPGRPRDARAAARRQRLPRRGEERGGHAGVVGGPPAVARGEPRDRRDGAQGRRFHLPGAQPGDGGHPRHRPRRRGPVVRLRQPARVPARPGHGRHRVPPPDAAHLARGGRRPGDAGARAAEPRRAHLRARALGDAARHGDLTSSAAARSPGSRSPRRSAATCCGTSPARPPTTTWSSPPTASPAPPPR